MALFSISFDFDSDTAIVSDITVTKNIILDNYKKIDPLDEILLDNLSDDNDQKEEFNFNFNNI